MLKAHRGAILRYNGFEHTQHVRLVNGSGENETVQHLCSPTNVLQACAAAQRESVSVGRPTDRPPESERVRGLAVCVVLLGAAPPPPRLVRVTVCSGSEARCEERRSPILIAVPLCFCF